MQQSACITTHDALELECSQQPDLNQGADAIRITAMLQKTTRNDVSPALRNPIDQRHVQR